MRKIPTILLAVMIGVAIEAALCVISVVVVLAGGFGPCGPTGDAPSFVRVIHQPGFWLAGFLVEDSSPSYLLLAVGITTVFLSILALVILRFGIGNNEIHRPNTALEPTAAAPSVSGTPSSSNAGSDSTSTSSGGVSALDRSVLTI